MNVFFEFHKIVQHLQEADVEYALIGGVAMAFYVEPRFTKDIDILIAEDNIDKITELLGEENYKNYSTPFTFKNSNLTLNRFIKFADNDEMIIDVLTVKKKEFLKISVEEFNSPGTGIVKVVSRKDLIKLKKQRNSKIDQADIEGLKNEETR